MPKLTAKERELAKRAARRIWCLGHIAGIHDMRPTMLPDGTLGKKCLNCPLTTK